MKFELVMLITLISMITERQVEANLRCYENRGRTGKAIDITVSTPDVERIFPHGIRACEVSPNSSWIFYVEKDYEGVYNTFHGNGDVYLPMSSSIPLSILRLGNQSHPNGLFLFERKMFQGGLSQKFVKKNENVKAHSTFRSAVVIGPLDWTIVSQCHLTDCERQYQTCLQHGRSGASFIESFNGIAVEETLKVIPGGCSGTKYTGKFRIPECPCNQHGVVDGPDKCKGIKGICQCKANHTGDDCDSCISTHTWREGKCVGGCGCNPHGVFNNDMTCSPPKSPNGTCNCDRDAYGGKKCERCLTSYYKKNGRCIYCPCTWKNTNTHWYYRTCGKLDGHCSCKPKYAGDFCDRCIHGYWDWYEKCLNEKQYNKMLELEDFYLNQKTDKTELFSLLDDLKALGVVDHLANIRRFVRGGTYTPYKAAGYVLNKRYKWKV